MTVVQWRHTMSELVSSYITVFLLGGAFVAIIVGILRSKGKLEEIT